MRRPILRLSCRLFLAKNHITHICQPHYSPDLAPCDFWLYPKLNSPLKGRRFVNVTVIRHTRSVNGVSLLNDSTHERVTVHGWTIRSTLTGCQVTSRPRGPILAIFKMVGYFPDNPRIGKWNSLSSIRSVWTNYRSAHCYQLWLCQPWRLNCCGRLGSVNRQLQRVCYVAGLSIEEGLLHHSQRSCDFVRSPTRSQTIQTIQILSAFARISKEVLHSSSGLSIPWLWKRSAVSLFETSVTVYKIFISLYCFLPVQYLNYIFIFQQIALNCYIL